MSKRQDPIKRNTTLKLQRVPVVSTTQPIILDDHLANVPPESNSYLRQKEKLEHDHVKHLPAELQSLLPTLDDTNFATKLVQHAEFHAPPSDPVLDVEKESDQVCSSNVDVDDDDDDQFLPHQLFVRQFLSPKSPYNSLLLYHSATANQYCAAIGVAEEWRQQQEQKIVVVTSRPDDFRRTLFQPKMLEPVGNDRVVAKWGCATEGLLRDVNPLNRPLSIDQAVQQIQDLIENAYEFVGSFPEGTTSPTLIVLDNVPVTTEMLNTIRGQKLLLLSAFPMRHSPTEIIPLVNLMNANDGRGTIDKNEVFDPKTLQFVDEHKENGHYVQEGGYDLLKRKLTGYVSYLRSETPYTHALRLYPDVFAPDRVFRESTSLLQSVANLFASPFVGSKAVVPIEYPDKQIHGQPSTNRLRHLPMYLTALGEEQEQIYTKTLQGVHAGDSLKPLLQDLIMTYPLPALSDNGKERATLDDWIKPSSGTRFEYRYPNERIFSPSRLSKLSGKLSSLCQSLAAAAAAGKRILVVASSVKEGLLPLALALEEAGLAAPLGGTPLLTAAAAGGRPVRTFGFLLVNDEDVEGVDGLQIDTADKADIVLATFASLIPRLHNIRQIHVLDPPAYLHHIEEIIASAIFPRSHCGLPFAQRNVEIYMHASVSSTASIATHEMADVYVYRTLTDAAMAIGRVTRLMKEVAVDCLFQPRDFSMEHMGTVDKNRNVEIQTASMPKLTLQVVGGDRPYSAVCDYMQTCTLPAWSSAQQRPTWKAPMLLTDDVQPLPRITQRLRQLFQEKTVYPRTDLFAAIQRPRLFPLEEVMRELARLVATKSDVFYDQYGRRGYLVSRGSVYAFQPVEITDTYSDAHDRTVPVETKPLIQGGQGTRGTRGGDMALYVDVATGDSDVQLKDPWYQTMREWFNELQLVHHMTPSQIRKIVVDHALEVMDEKEQIALLKRVYSKIQAPATSPTEQRIRESLNRRLVHDDDLRGAGSLCQLGPRTYRQTSPDSWVQVHNMPPSQGQGWLDDDGHLHLCFLQKKGAAAAKDISKKDLLIFLQKEEGFSKVNLGKRNVTLPQLLVLIEVLLRHKQQQQSTNKTKQWFE
jgi:hypothetical protein